MTDRLGLLLNHFELKARVFQNGPLCQIAAYDGAGSAGHLHVLREGAMRLRTAGARTMTLRVPSLIFHPRPVAHRLEPLDSDGVDLVCATVDLGARLQSPLTQGLPPVVVLPLAQHGSLDATLRVLFAEAGNPASGQLAVLNRLFEVVVVLLLRHLLDEGLVSTGVLAGLADSRLARAIQAMHLNPAQTFTLDSMAHSAGMSRSRFALKFREVVGQTPHGYLTAWRLSLAQSLLYQGKPVNIVASEVGYESASALARAFHAKLGISPTDWMRREIEMAAHGPT